MSVELTKEPNTGIRLKREAVTSIAMSRGVVQSLICYFFCVLVTSNALLAQTQIPPSLYEQVTTTFQQGKLVEAEQILRMALREHPLEGQALGLLGVILDAQKRFEEAERCYTKALSLAPGSVALHNNLGNHYLNRGLRNRARMAFLRAVALDSHHPNANLQLAQISLNQKDGPGALRYLDHLPAAEQNSPPVQLLRAQALYFGGQKTSAEALLNQLENQASDDSRLAFSLGMVFVGRERFQDAERTFSLALHADPTNFDILYNLGLAARRAGHLERAEEVFLAALRLRPQDVDSLFGLARVYAEQNKCEMATVLLVQAQRPGPQRTDIPLLLAQCSEKLGYYGDTAVAFDQYLKLKPDDDKARRERGFALVRSGEMKDGIRDLQWYVQKYPKDAEGLYQLALAEMTGEREKALQHLTQALQNKPNLLPARFARAVLHYQEGRATESIEDLKFVLQQEPDNVRALDQLSQSYLLRQQAQEAVSILSRAVELAPKDPTVLIHYSRALRRLGHKEKADLVLAQFKAIGPEEGRQRPRSGLFDYLSLSPEERKAQYLANLQKSLESSPNDPTLKLRLGKAMLAEGKLEQALANFRDIPELTSDAKILSECGKALIEHQQYEAAKTFLERALNSDPSATQILLDLALATFHVTGPEAGLQELDQTPVGERNGDYFLLRAQLLDALGRPEEAGEALNQAFKAAPTRSDLYFQAALFLVKHGKNSEALQLLQQAARLVPDAPELMLSRAVLLEMLQQPKEATRLLAQMQSRWPEWGVPYFIHGVILETHLFSEEAKALLETAIALGENDPLAYYYLALATLNATPDDAESVRKTISRAVQLSPEDPYIRALAGRNALRRKEYATAIEHLMAALRYKPDLVEAHYALSAAYRASGNHEKSAAELEEAQRLEKEKGGEDSSTTPIRDLLFIVRPPSRNP